MKIEVVQAGQQNNETLEVDDIFAGLVGSEDHYCVADKCFAIKVSLEEVRGYLASSGSEQELVSRWQTLTQLSEKDYQVVEGEGRPSLFGGDVRGYLQSLAPGLNVDDTFRSLRASVDRTADGTQKFDFRWTELRDYIESGDRSERTRAVLSLDGEQGGVNAIWQFEGHPLISDSAKKFIADLRTKTSNSVTASIEVTNSGAPPAESASTQAVSKSQAVGFPEIISELFGIFKTGDDKQKLAASLVLNDLAQSLPGENFTKEQISIFVKNAGNSKTAIAQNCKSAIVALCKILSDEDIMTLFDQTRLPDADVATNSVSALADLAFYIPERMPSGAVPLFANHLGGSDWDMTCACAQALVSIAGVGDKTKVFFTPAILDKISAVQSEGYYYLTAFKTEIFSDFDSKRIKQIDIEILTEGLSNDDEYIAAECSNALNYVAKFAPRLIGDDAVAALVNGIQKSDSIAYRNCHKALESLEKKWYWISAFDGPASSGRREFCI